MRRIVGLFAVFLAIGDAAAAQSTPKVEIGGTVGVISARPPEIDDSYYQDWYAQGRYAAAIGYFWTTHLKTELEHAWSGEGSRYLFSQTGPPHQTEQFFQLQQTTLRVVWQFLDNQWVHPYLSAGAVLDVEHERSYVPFMFQPDPRGGPPVIVTQERNFGDRYNVRGGVAIGGGAKIYMTDHAFFNAGGVVTYAKKAGTVNLVAGFGVEF